MSEASFFGPLPRLLFPTLAVVLGIGCTEANEAPARSEAGTISPGAAGGSSPEAPTPSSEIVAVVDGESIRRIELEARLRLRLYELELRAHRLRHERLLELIAARLAPDAGAEEATQALLDAERSGRVEIRLEPPERPRLSVPPGDAPTRGADEAPVTLVVFCDFESSHCARFQPVLRELLEDFPEVLRIAHRDHPLPFHREATGAAVAARCAGAQGAYFRYHDALYTRERLDSEARREIARALGLDVERFLACVDGRTDVAALDAVEKDAAIAARLGLPRVPTSFLNGLYVPGAAEHETLVELIHEELEEIGATAGAESGAQTEDTIPVTELPLRLVATAAYADPERSVATIESPRFEAPRVFGTGDVVLEDAHLDRIEPRRVLLRRADDRLEQLPLQGRGPGAAPPPQPQLDAAGVLHVPRERIDRALEDREALERVLEPGRLDLEGKRLLKIEQIEEGGLYDLLGLQEKDVLMQVDGVFVHDAYNPLFEALRTQERVRVTVMRGGFPKTLEIAIE